MFKRLSIGMLLLISISICWGLFSDNYPIGILTNYKGNHSTPALVSFAQYNLTEFLPFLRDANFNLLLVGKYSPEECNTLKEYYLDCVYHDSNLISYSQASKYRYQAEYYNYPHSQDNTYNSTDHPDVTIPDNEKEKWFYAITQSSSIVQSCISRNNGSLLCSRINNNNGYLINNITEFSDTLRPLEAQIWGEAVNYNVKIRLKAYNFIPNSNQNTQICNIQLKYLKNDGTYATHDFTNFPILTKGAYDALPYESGTDYKILNLVINRDALFPTVESQQAALFWEFRYKYFFPTVYTFNNSDIAIDYIEIEDSAHQLLVNNPVTFTLPTLPDNVVAYEGSDEPSAPNMHSRSEINALLPLANRKPFLQAVNLSYWYWAKNNKYYLYNHEKLYNMYYPETPYLTPDYYPCMTNIKWNTDTGVTSDNWDTFQKQLNRLTEIYADTKTYCVQNNKEFRPIVQSFGYKSVTGRTHWYGFVLPPGATQKMLAYLPLCYGADGINYFTFEQKGTPTNPFEKLNDQSCYTVGLLNKNAGNAWSKTLQYDEIKEANANISYIGSTIKQLDPWNINNVKTLSNTTVQMPVNLNNINSISMRAYDSTTNTHNPAYNEGYSGYVDCALYKKSSANEIYFLLVNRRTCFSKMDPITINDNTIDYGYLGDNNPELAFVDADPQTVTFNFGVLNNNGYKLIDMLSGEIININLEADRYVATFSIGAGECRFLKYANTTDDIPSLVTQGQIRTLNSLNINKNITIQSGGRLNLTGNTVLVPNHTILVQQGGTLSINGTLLTGANANINVFGSLLCNDANLSALSNKWNGIVLDTTATATLTNTEIDHALIGIDCTSNYQVTLNHATFNNCNTSISLSNRTLLTIVDALQINVPKNGIGIQYNKSANSECNVIGNNNAVTQITGDGTNTGILTTEVSSNNSGSGTIVSMKLLHITFNNLATCVNITSFASTSLSAREKNSISYCSFTNSTVGIYAFGTGNISSIDHNNFNNCSGYGIHSNGVAINITQNTFSQTANTGTQIFFDNITRNGSKATYNTFTNNNSNLVYATGIKILGTSARCDHNHFYINYSDESPLLFLNTNRNGISIYDNSYIDLSNSAFNVFDSQVNILAFGSTTTNINGNGMFYMYNGHNDFYQSRIHSCDLYVYNNWNPVDQANNSVTRLYMGGNFWRDSNVNVNIVPTTATLNVTIDALPMDSSPNVTTKSNPPNRFYEALYNESEGDLKQAKTIYESILNECNSNEKEYWVASLDRLFGMISDSTMTESSFMNDIEYYITKLPDSLEVVTKNRIINSYTNYKLKCLISIADYEQALALAELKKANALSYQDSLYYEMYIETIDQFIAMFSQKSDPNGLIDQTFNAQLVEYTKRHDKLLSLYFNDESYTDSMTDNQVQSVTSCTNYPNPFNPETTIAFNLPLDSHVKLEIYNIKGQKVKTLLNTNIVKGSHKVVWNGRNESNHTVASGIYFYSLKTSQKTLVKKMLMLK